MNHPYPTMPAIARHTTQGGRPTRRPSIGSMTGSLALTVSLAVLLFQPTGASGASVASADADAAIPHYPTRPPPAMTLRYEVGHGVLKGTGDIVWQPAGDRYELGFDFRLSGLKLLAQTSRGRLDADGLAPDTFTEQRFGKQPNTARFDRAAGKITYSGSADEARWHAGAQDRLSWMMQLASIVAATPALARADAKIAMQVTSSRGDAEIWTFRCLGTEPVGSRQGEVRAVKFVREPRDPHDTTVQVWLDPARHDVPMRATQKSGSDDEGFELRLVDILPAPKSGQPAT